MDRDDVIYFDLFRHQIIYDLGGHIHFHFWGHIVLRETMRDECVRRAVIAIGALAHAFCFTSESRSQCVIRTSFFPTRSCTEDFLNTSHRAAIRSYISAISLCAKRIRDGAYSSSPRSALIITIVLVAFEFLQGNMKAADGLMKSCILLFTRLRCLLGQTHGQPGLSPRPAFGAADAVDNELEHILPCLSVMSGFTRLCASQHDLLASLPVGSGEVFPNLERASTTEALAQWTDFYTRNLVFVMQMQRNHCYGYPYVYAKTKAARGEFLAHQEMWSEVMSMLLACEEDPHILKGIKVARIHYIMINVLTQCCLDPTEMTYDNFFLQFQDILEGTLALLLENEPMAKIHFTFCGHLAPPLCLAASKCRHLDLRTNFLQVISRLPCREGPWDPKTRLLGLTGLTRLEDAGRDETGYVPSAARWIWTEAQWDSNYRYLVAKYTKVDSNGGIPAQTRLVLN